MCAVSETVNVTTTHRAQGTIRDNLHMLTMGAVWSTAGAAEASSGGWRAHNTTQKAVRAASLQSVGVVCAVHTTGESREPHARAALAVERSHAGKFLVSPP